MQFFTQYSELVKAADASAAGTDTVGVTIDTHGYHCIAFITTIATPAVDNYVYVSQGDEADGSDAVELYGSETAPEGETAQAVYVDVVRPTKRYVSLDVVRGTSTAVGEVYALLYSPRYIPVTQTEMGAQLIDPVEVAGS